MPYKQQSNETKRSYDLISSYGFHKRQERSADVCKNSYMPRAQCVREMHLHFTLLRNFVEVVLVAVNSQSVFANCLLDSYYIYVYTALVQIDSRFCGVGNEFVDIEGLLMIRRMGNIHTL